MSAALLGPEHLPLYYGQPLDVVQHIFDFVHEAIVKTAWSDERIRTRYGRRTVREILADGDTFALAHRDHKVAARTAILRQHGGQDWHREV